MSKDVKSLELAARSLREAADIIERATAHVGCVDPEDLETMIDEARSRFIERAARYDLEPASDSEHEAIRAAVEPLARRIIGQQMSVDDLWRDYSFRLGSEAPKEAFESVVRRVVAAVGPARRQRAAIRQIEQLLDGKEAVSTAALWEILNK